MDLALLAYRQTSSFPKEETYCLTQQIRRCAISVPSNIAEGEGRNTRKEFNQFLFHARGSLLELQTQMMIAERLGYVSKQESTELLGKASTVGRSLTGLINSLSDKAA